MKWSGEKIAREYLQIERISLHFTFTYMHSLIIIITLMTILLGLPLHRWETEDLERMNNLPRVTQQTNESPDFQSYSHYQILALPISLQYESIEDSEWMISYFWCLSFYFREVVHWICCQEKTLTLNEYHYTLKI